jgi:transmembrane sensor
LAPATREGNEGDPERAEAFEWLMRIEAAPGDASLRAALDAWLAGNDARQRAYRSVERMWRVSGGLAADYAGHVPAVAAGEVHRLEVRHRRNRRLFGFAAAALAACLFLLCLPTLQLRLAADHLTGTAELRDTTLEDGSIVHLDAGSAITVHYGASRRQVRLLAGRAFFEVVPGADRPFVVSAGDVTVTVTGTAFDVRSSSDAVSVAVQSGTVQVALVDNQASATLTPGERLDIDRKVGRMTKSDVPPQDIAAWRQRRLVVDGVPLAEVIDELGRHYDGAIVVRDRALAARRITGVFDLRRPIEALQAVVRAQQGSVTEITPYLQIVSGH